MPCSLNHTIQCLLHFPLLQGCIVFFDVWHHFKHIWKVISLVNVDRFSTINFQNNAQVQTNAWFKLTPGTKHTVYNLFQKKAWFNLMPGLMPLENN